jgi:hypothetical protein
MMQFDTLIGFDLFIHQTMYRVIYKATTLKLIALVVVFAADSDVESDEIESASPTRARGGLFARVFVWAGGNRRLSDQSAARVLFKRAHARVS